MQIPPGEPERYWLSGLLEAEGHFNKPLKSNGTLCTKIKLEMCDHDVISHVASLTGSRIFTRPARGNWRETYHLHVTGARGRELMCQIYPLLGERRRQRVHNILQTAAERLPQNRQRWQTVWAQHQQGMTIREIAGNLGISHTQVHNIIKRMRQYANSDETPQLMMMLNSPPSPTNDPALERWWLIGLLEGEATFMAGPPSKRTSLSITINMTDHDVLQRAARAMHIQSIFLARAANPDRSHRASYVIRLRGKRARQLMQEIYPHVSLKRQQQIRLALESPISLKSP